MSARSTSKKRPITLVESLISIALLTLLLGTLFFWYRHLTENKAHLEKLTYPLIEERHLMQRLERILPQAKPPFYADEQTLVMRFDRGLSSEPLLSDTVLAKLYHDPSLNALCLGIWPDPLEHENRRTPSLTLTLLDKVDALSFSYYSPPDPFRQPVDPKQVGKRRPEAGWQSTWHYETLPALVTLTLTRGATTRILYFDLNHPIIYPTGLEA